MTTATENPFARFAPQTQPPQQPANPFARFAPQAQPAAPAEPGPAALPPAVEATTRVGGLGAQEMVRGMTNLAGFPVDVINMLPMIGNILPGEQGFGPISDNPVGGSRWLYDNVQRRPVDFLVENVENPVRAALDVQPAATGDIVPQNMFERIFGRVMNEVGATAVPLVGAITAAGRVGVDGARRMGGPVGDILERVALNPGRAAGLEGMYAIGAGTGAGVAREFVSDNDPNTETTAETWADILGAIGGAGLTAGTHYAASGANAFGGAALGTQAYGDRVVQEAVTDTLLRQAGDNSAIPDADLLAYAISGGNRVADVVPGFADTLADRTGNPGLASLEYGRQSGPNAGLFNARRTENAAAAQQSIGSLRPTEQPGAFSDELTRATEDYLAGISNEAASAERAATAAAEPLSPAMGGEDRGQIVRSALDQSLREARDREREAWSSIGGEVAPDALSEAFNGVTSGLTQAERTLLSGANDLINIPAGLTENAAGGAVDLREVTTLRSTLSEQIRAAQNAGDSNLARVLGKYVEAIDGYLDTAAPNQAQALEQARAVSRELNDRFSRPGDPVAQAVQRGEGGVPRMPDSRVAPTFLQPDEREASRLARLLVETNNAPEVREAMRDQILADVRSRNLLNDPQRLDAYLASYADAFDMFPELRQELGSAASLRFTADTAALQAEQELRRLTQRGQSAVADYLSFGDERASDAMAAVIASRDPAAKIDELLTMAGGKPEAIEGARAAFWNLMERRTRSSGASTRSAADGTQPWKPQALHNFLSDPATAAVAERLYADNPEHLENLRQIVEATRLTETRTTARAPSSSGTPQAIAGSDILPSTETLGSRAFAVQRGVVSPGFAGFNIAAIIARRAVTRNRMDAFNRLMDEALLNPDLARALIQENNPRTRAALARPTTLWRASLTGEIRDLLEGALEEDEPQSEDDQMLDAIMGGGQ